MISNIAKLLIIFACLSLSACAVPGKSARQAPASPAAEKQTPRFSDAHYTVRGKTYYILATARGYDETGLATWYGGRFHGRKTASGERFSIHKLTAAHKTLPFGTLVEVSNPQNGRKVTVRINDRGPFSDDHIIDLSKAAAEAIGMKHTIKVRAVAIE